MSFVDWEAVTSHNYHQSSFTAERAELTNSFAFSSDSLIIVKSLAQKVGKILLDALQVVSRLRRGHCKV